MAAFAPAFISVFQSGKYEEAKKEGAKGECQL